MRQIYFAVLTGYLDAQPVEQSVIQARIAHDLQGVVDKIDFVHAVEIDGMFNGAGAVGKVFPHIVGNRGSGLQLVQYVLGKGEKPVLPIYRIGPVNKKHRRLPFDLSSLDQAGVVVRGGHGLEKKDLLIALKIKRPDSAAGDPCGKKECRDQKHSQKYSFLSCFRVHGAQPQPNAVSSLSHFKNYGKRIGRNAHMLLENSNLKNSQINLGKSGQIACQTF